MLRKKMNLFNNLINLLIVIIGTTSLNSCMEEQQEEHFYFIQITDTHFESGDNLDRTQKAVELINNLPMKINCVVHTGDITTNKLEDEKLVDSGLSILEKFTVPIHYVPGNHDILSQKLESTYKVYIEKFGGLISQAEYDNVLFLFVYTEPLRKSLTIKGYQPMKQLEELLKKSSGKPVIIFHHAPSVDDFYNNKFHKSWEKEIREKWVKLINAYNVKAVIAGHFHRDEHHWLGDIPLYISSPISGYWGRQATFRIYEYSNGKIGYRTQYIE
ncbi:metallophosphoesterase family protein [Bacteroidota bacterium]